MIVDFHTHVFPPAFIDRRTTLLSQDAGFKSIYTSSGAKLAAVEELIQAMDKDGVDRSVILGFPWERKELYRRHNDYILEAVQLHPDRLTGFCSFSPLAPNGGSEAERCLRSGLAGVGELAVYGRGLSRRVSRALSDVMAVCRELNRPVLIHANEPVGHGYPGKTPMSLGQLYRFLKAYPDNRIVLGHWGGGICFYALMRREVETVFQNVWFDTAASPFLYRPEVYRLVGEMADYGKILFGSDYPLLGASRYFTEMNESHLPAGTRGMIQGENAAKLLNLSAQPSLPRDRRHPE